VYLGQSLPQSFSLGCTRLERVTAIWNVIDGECGGVRVISFDCRVGSGKRSWQRTAIAAQAPPRIFGMMFNLDLAIDRSGEWSIMYESRPFSIIAAGLMSASELEAHFDSIGC
jgi:hypothetical protein